VTFHTLDPDDQLGYLLARAAAQSEREWARALQAQGINPRQFSMLALVVRAPGISQAELARRVMITPQSASESLGALESQGLIARAPAEPGRASKLELTAQGKALLRRAYPVVENVQREIFRGLSKREQVLLGQLLRKVLTSTVDKA